MSASAGPDDESEIPEHPQLMRDRGLFHLNLGAEFTNRARPGAQSGQYPNPTRRRKNRHHAGDFLCRLLGERAADLGMVRLSHVGMFTCAYMHVKRRGDLLRLSRNWVRFL